MNMTKNQFVEMLDDSKLLQGLPSHLDVNESVYIMYGEDCLPIGATFSWEEVEGCDAPFVVQYTKTAHKSYVNDYGVVVHEREENVIHRTFYVNEGE